ncbi:MAG: glycosyltransferase family 4 protein [Lachnospiraceae bacterium]|nr:glycosyltransferase family 4 protein [Lachnospiraceae bacterium]
MNKVLIITGRYLPGYRDGGPVRSLINLTEWMGDEYDIRIMCLDRDHGDTERYPDIKVNEYNTVGKAKVWYTPEFKKEDIQKLADDVDLVYVCGPYSDYARLAMSLKKEGKIRAPFYVASMGSFSPEAFNIKGLKKRLFISYMKMTHMFDDVSWSVTSQREEHELKAVIGSGCKCVVASDLPRKGTTEHTHIKEDGSLKICFISRISRKKNLIAIPEILKEQSDDCRIKLDIYGADEDKVYLRECLDKLDELRKTHPDCRWEYKGEADGSKIPSIFAEYDAFLFPTLGENYGHVIAESLASGCIPIISDTTPWLDLAEKGCGFVCPSGDITSFASAVKELYEMNEEAMSAKRGKCYDYITSANDISVKHSGYRTIFG